MTKIQAIDRAHERVVSLLKYRKLAANERQALLVEMQRLHTELIKQPSEKRFPNEV